MPKTTLTPLSPEIALEKGNAITVFAPRHIHDSYNAMLRFFEGDITPLKVLQGSYMIYGWMPTMLKLKGPSDTLWALAQKARLGTAEENTENILQCAKTLNNSLVGTSKLMHFLNPDKYPIWDSRVFSALFETKSQPYKIENIDNFLLYLQWIRTFCKTEGFETLKTKFEAEAGYTVTKTRAAEATLFSLGKKIKKK
jgi:hypothetical protein